MEVVVVAGFGGCVYGYWECVDTVGRSVAKLGWGKFFLGGVGFWVGVLDGSGLGRLTGFSTGIGLIVYRWIGGMGGSL